MKLEGSASSMHKSADITVLCFAQWKKGYKKKDHFLLASDPKTFYKLNKVTIDFSEC